MKYSLTTFGQGATLRSRSDFFRAVVPETDRSVRYEARFPLFLVESWGTNTTVKNENVRPFGGDNLLE